MDRRRAAAALLALAACIVCSSAAPTASNPTALDLHDGPTEGCYYNFQHYGEGDRIMTNEPCLNCTCHNRMLMCYLRVCPFTKAIGQDCTVEKRADQCCPIVTCPDVPVDLLTSTSTSSPAEYGPTGVGKLDKYGCSIHNKYFPEGSKVPSSPNKPCEHCYCIRNMTTCVMQECTLHVDGCTPIYHKDVCCPVRYSCDHLEDEIPLLDDMTTTVRPTQGFLLTTTTMTPVTQMTQDCIHEEQIFPDGASIKTDKACEHCYCMKGDIVCVVQECGTPMENEGKNCTSLSPRHGQCCPDTYICEGDEPNLDFTTERIDLTSVPPRRLGVEGSGYRNEPDEPITEKSPFEQDIEGSGDVSETDFPTKVSPTIRDELLLITTEKDAIYSQTTEADKKLNPITDQILEKEPFVTLGEDSFTRSTESTLLTSTGSKATIADEIITSDGVTSKHEDDIIDTEAPIHSYERDEILPTDISIDKDTSFNLPEQSTTVDEHSGHSVTETTTSIKKETENILGSTDSVAPYDVTTTELPIIFSVTEKDKSNDESSEINKIDIVSEITNSDISVTEQNKLDFDYSTIKELHIVEDETTVSSIKNAAETTSINPVDNEVDYIPGRIPGEGDCLLNGVTYSDNTSVPSTNNCHTGCKCISSIIKCDPIICSPPPEYMENMNDCQTSYDSPDACCPTFVCSAKETSLPQSHSQTSVTESSKPVVAEECNGNDCSSSEVRQPPIEPHKICDSGNCESGPKQNECGINGCQGEEQTPLDRPVDCTGDKCSVSPIVSCEGENCDTAPTEEKDVDKNIHTVSPNKPICNDDGGCDNINDTSSTQDECNDETCRRKETFETETNIQAECSGTQCKIDNEQKISLSEPTIAPVTEYILNEENTESNSVEKEKTASPVPNIITPEKAITTESTTAIDTEQAIVKEQLPDKTPTDIITEEPIKLVTDIPMGITHDTVTKIDNTDRIVTAVTDNPQEEIIKSETSPTELNVLDSATEITTTSDEASIKQQSYTRAPGQDETEAFTESRLVDYTSENKDTSSLEYTKEISQTTTQKSETHSDIYETKPVESVTKLPILTDIEKEINTMEMPNLPASNVKVTAESEDYPITTEKLEAISVSDEKIDITLQPTKIQDNAQTELPESATELEGGNEDHSELIPTETQELTSEIIQDDKTDEYNKFTTVKSITSPGITENPESVQTETQSILLETVSSESTISTEIHKTYTEEPQTVGTKSDIVDDSNSYITVKLDESNNKYEEPTTPSSDGQRPEEFSTKLDEIISGDGHSEAETENQEYATTERKPSIFNDDEQNVDLNLHVTERQTTISQLKPTVENEIEQERETKLPNVDKITERTEIQMTTESHKETEVGDFMDRDSQNIPVTDQDLNKDFSVTESAHPYTSNEDLQPARETTSKDQNLDLQTSTTSQDISATKDTSTASVIRDEGDTEVTSSTDKNIIKITSSSDESLTETKYTSYVAGDEELTTSLPNEKLEPHPPTKDFKLTTVYLENPIETTTSVLLTEEKQQTPELEMPEKPTEEENERIKDITTELPTYIKDIIDEDSSRLPELISPNGDTTDIPSDKEKITTSSISNTKEEDIIDNNLQEITPTTLSNIYMSESVTEKINMQPQEHPTQESSAEGSSEKSDVNGNDLITDSPYSETGSIDFDKYSTIAPTEYEVDQTTKLPVSEINNDIKPISTSVPLLSQDDEIITEKTPIVGTEEKESTTEKSEYDIITEKSEQPPVTISTESDTDHDIFQNTVIDDKQIEILDKVTEISPTANESEMQNTESSSSVQEHENPSSEVLKPSTEVPLESDLTTQQEHQTVATIPKDQSKTELSFEGMPTSDQTYMSSSKSDIEIEDVGTTESVSIKQEELPIRPEMSVENIYTINDLMTTEVEPIKHDELPKHPETASMDTVLPELDRTEEQEDISKIDSDTLTTESLTTSKPSWYTPTDVSKTDTTKLTVMLEEQPLPSKVPEPVLESTTQIKTESVTEQGDIEPYTTEKQYVSKSDQEEVHKIPELSEEPITTETDTEIVSKQEDFGTFTTEKQYVTKSDQDDIPKIPVLVDEQSNSQSDIESVTKLDDTESYNTEKQYTTKSDQDDIPKTPVLIDEQSNSQSDIESVTKLDDTGSYNTEKQYVTESDEEVPDISKIPEEQSTDETLTENVSKTEDSQPITTEKAYVTKLDEEISKLPEQIEEQSTTRADIESATQLEDTEPLVTEKQYVTKLDQEEVPKITVPIDEQSTSQSDTEFITKLNDIEPYTTEKQYVTKSEEDEVSKIPEPSEEQSTARTDTEIISEQEGSGSITTEKQYVTKTDDEDIPKIPVLDDEQTPSQSDIESITKLDEIEPFVTEKQYITNSDQEEIPKVPVMVNEEDKSQSDVESITKLNDIEPYTTEKQYVTKSSEGGLETPELPKEQSTDRTDIEAVSKTEDAGPFTTERQYVTKLEQEVPKTPEPIEDQTPEPIEDQTPEPIEDQSTSRYESESITKLEDTEPFVTEKQYVSSSDQEETPNFPVLSEEQSTSQIDTESVTKMDDSGSDHEETSPHKLDTDVTKPEQDSKNTEKITTEPLIYPDTTVKSELEGSGLYTPSEDVTVVPQKEDSPGITVSTSIPQKVETPIITDTENLDDIEKYSTERNVQTIIPEDGTVILDGVTDAKPYEIEHKTPSKLSTEDEAIYSETTPYSVLLEEHTHPVLEDTSSIIPIEEGTTTTRNEVPPERGDQIPDTPEINDEYERTTLKQIEGERTTSYEKISSPIIHSSDAGETTTSVEKIASSTGVQDEDKKYSPSMQDEELTTPIVLPTIKDKEQDTTSPTMLEKELTTLGDVSGSTSKPELTSSSSKDTQELSPSSTSKLQEETTTHLPASEDQYKEKPLISSPSPSSSEMPDILGEPHEEEHLPDFPPSGTGAGYGQEPDYVEEDQSFGPGTCRYGGKVYVSAQQIPRDDPCDFCFCFRSDIICLQQSCPPPIHGCHEEPIQGFCCPRYECPVSMATTMNVTTTTTTTTTTLPPHFLPHAYKGAAQRRGCQIKGHSYKVGEVVRASSGPCLHCTCGGDGQMKCDPKACTPEPMLRQMIAAAVSAKRRR